jgi:hypothetical protein
MEHVSELGQLLLRMEQLFAEYALYLTIAAITVAAVAYYCTWSTRLAAMAASFPGFVLQAAAILVVMQGAYAAVIMGGLSIRNLFSFFVLLVSNLIIITLSTGLFLNWVPFIVFLLAMRQKHSQSGSACESPFPRAFLVLSAILATASYPITQIYLEEALRPPEKLELGKI